jgi:hypothetical protein
MTKKAFFELWDNSGPAKAGSTGLTPIEEVENGVSDEVKSYLLGLSDNVDDIKEKLKEENCCFAL